MKAYIKYTKRGKIIPGSLILRPNNTPPSDGTYQEVNADLCCDFDPRILVKLGGLTYSSKPYDGNTQGSAGGFPTIIEGVLPQDIGKVSVVSNNDPFSYGAQFVNAGPGNHIGCYINDAVLLTGPLAYKYKFDPYAITGYANITP